MKPQNEQSFVQLEARWSSRRGAFTAIELIVAITILAIVLTATSVIWSTQQVIIRAASAHQEVSPYGRAIESNLRRDLQGLSRDGFMVIRSHTIANVAGEPAHNYAMDQLMFFANGLKSSVGTPGTSTMTSRVWYGHLMTTDWGASQVLPNAGTLPWKLSLGRQDLLLEPGAGPAAPNSIWAAQVFNGQFDCAVSDMLSIKRTIFNSASPAAQMSNACERVTGQRYVSPASVNTNGIMDIHALLAPFCSSFRVQYAGRYNAATPIGQVDQVGSQIQWYGNNEANTASTFPTLPAGTSQVVGGDTIVFSPDQPDLWPSLICITVDLHDSNGRLHEMFTKKPTTTGGTFQNADGYQFRFIIKL